MSAPSNINGLYVHVPFCDGKCHYCAFYSVPYHSSLADAWFAALRKEWENAQAEFGPMAFSSIYFGGGTPSLLPLRQMESLLQMAAGSVLRSVRDGSGVEWTSEANPGSLSAEKLSLLRSHGVNRISLGVQAMDDEVLRRLGRRHSVSDIRTAVAQIRQAGFTNWGLDLIACVPGVSREAWCDTVKQALALDPLHVSVYALTSEEGSRFAKEEQDGLITLLDDGEQLAMLEVAADLLDGKGLKQYEISNFAQPGFECRHNVACWQGGNYLGLGCAAASRVGKRRWTNKSNLNHYVASMCKACDPASARDEDLLSSATDAVERIIFGLRMNEGIDLDLILTETGMMATDEESHWRKTLTRLETEGLLHRQANRWCLTKRGRALADHVAVELMP